MTGKIREKVKEPKREGKCLPKDCAQKLTCRRSVTGKKNLKTVGKEPHNGC